MKLVYNLVLPFGTWKGHMMGEETYTEADGLYVVHYFSQTYKASNNTMVIDYEHATLYNNEAPAAGWIHDLEVFFKYDSKLGITEEQFEPGVYMLNEWTDRALEYISNGEYRYLSPVIIRNAPDPVTGADVPIQLFNVALTNVPFMLDKMTIVQYKDKKMFAMLHKLRKKDMKDQTPKDATLYSRLGITATDPDVVESEFVQVLHDLQTFKNMVTLLDTDPGQAVATLQTLKNGIDPQKYVEVSAYNQLKNELIQLKASSLVMEYADRIPTQKDREVWVKMAITDYDRTKLTLETLPKVLHSNPVDLPAEDGNQDGLTDQQETIAKKLSLDPKLYKQHLK